MRSSLAAESTRPEVPAAVSAAKYGAIAGYGVKGYCGPTKRIAADPEVDLVAVGVRAM